jgi:hypothetical protein
MPPFGICFREEKDFPYAVEWSEDRPHDLADYLIEKGVLKHCQYLAHTKDWNDFLGCGTTTICRLSCDQVTEALNQTSWLKGTDLVDPEYYSEGVLAEKTPKNLKYHVIGLFRLLFASQSRTFQSAIHREGFSIEKPETHVISYYPHEDDYDPLSDSVYCSLKFGGVVGKMGKGDCIQSEQGVCPNLARKSKSPPKSTRSKAPKKQKKAVVDETAVKDYLKNLSLEQLEGLGDYIANLRLERREDAVDEEPTSPTEYECPEHYDEVELADGRKFWEHEETGDGVFPCADISKADVYEYSDADFTEVKLKV